MKTHLLVALAAILLASGCGAASGSPVLSTVDAIGRGISHAVGWCSDQGLDPSKLGDAKKALESGDYQGASNAVDQILAAARASGAKVPEDVEVEIRLVQGALAAQAIQDGMRALSGTVKP